MLAYTGIISRWNHTLPALREKLAFFDLDELTKPAAQLDSDGDETVARLLVDHTGSCPYHHVEDKGLERLVSPLGEGYEESAEQNDPDAMDEP
ncbi:hypothetical protein LY78DRAFT_682020 [Colletotrichum sublineola]|nr:hypothetical protein LY78DRAFT_682020 [Colletotrichum sublineola]